MKPAVILFLSALLIAACASRSLNAQEDNLCTAEQNAVVFAALRDSLDPANPRLPDYELASQHRSIYVRNKLGHSECAISESALPNLPGVSVKLVKERQFESLARKNGGKLAYVFLSSVAIDGDTARVWLGVSIDYANTDKGPNLCCCSGEMILRADSTGWVFDDWGLRVCA